MRIRKDLPMSLDNVMWLSIAILGFILVVVGAIRSRGKKPDYRAFFIMGVIWVAMGLLFNDISGFFGFGLIFLLYGLANYNKWDKPSQETM